MEELNELIESLLVDVAIEGIGATAGIGLIFGVFEALLELLASTV